ncbi:Uncharacterised protein [Vibrio cholerae]|nr:Uncharacterised protein [Vibrio cholerae]CSB99682.1 Uncharacterised protein [Vibrio cholerae]
MLSGSLRLSNRYMGLSAVARKDHSRFMPITAIGPAISPRSMPTLGKMRIYKP